MFKRVLFMDGSPFSMERLFANNNFDHEDPKLAHEVEESIRWCLWYSTDIDYFSFTDENGTYLRVGKAKDLKLFFGFSGDDVIIYGLSRAINE